MAQTEALFDQTDTGTIQVLQAYNGDVLTIPGDAWLLKADFSPQGSDLLLTGPDGLQVLIRDFFNLDIPPDLITDAGGVIPAELAIKLAGPVAPGQFALLQNGPFAELAQAAESIGRVEATDGLVEAVRSNGTKVTLAKGDDIFQGDTLITAKGAAIGITFVDDTTFSLGEEGRMVIDEMVYDPETQEGAFSANLVQGVFSFVSGEIAKTGVDSMTVTTPVATIGIRGTKVAGRAAQEGTDNTISLLPETLPDGTQIVGQLAVSNQGGGPPVVLSAAGATMQMNSAFAALPPPVVFSPEQIQQSFGATLTMQATTEVAKATSDAAQNAEEAQQSEAQAEQAAAEAEVAGAEAAAAEAEAEAAAAEAEAATAEAEAAVAEAEAAGDEVALAEAEAQVVEAETLVAEAETKAAEAEAQIAEAEVQAAEAEVAQAEAETKAAVAAESEAIAQHANNEMQAQAEAFAQFGGPTPGDGPAGGDAPPDGDAPPNGGDQQSGDGQGPDGGAVDQAAQDAVEQALADGATQEEAAAAGFEAAREQAIAEGASPEEIAAAEQAYNDAIAAGVSPADALQAAGDAAGQLNPEGPGGGFAGDSNSADGGGTFNGGSFGGGDPFFGGGGGDPFFGGGDSLFGGGDPFFDGGGGFYGDPLYGGTGDDFFGDPFGDPLFNTFDPLAGDIFVFDPNVYDPTFYQEPTVDTFAEVLSASINNDVLVGGDANTQFTMSLGTTLGGDDIVNGGGGTDEITFENIMNFQMVLDMATNTATYSSDASTTVYGTGTGGSVTGTVSLNSVEQVYASDGVVHFPPHIDITGDISGYGYIIAGTDADDTGVTKLDLRGNVTLSYLNALSNTPTGTTLSNTLGDTKGAIIFGLAGNDEIYGSSAGDVIYGGPGADTIYSGGGSDELKGGAGNDTYVIASGQFDISTQGTIANDSGTDTIQILGSNNFRYSSINSVTQLQWSASGTASLTGYQVDSSNPFAINTFIADAAGSQNNQLDIYASSGLVTDLSSVTFTNWGTSGADTINYFGTSFGDTFTGSANNEIIQGGAGNDTLSGGAGTDTVSYANSTSAVTVIINGAVSGGAGSDTLTGFENLTGSAYNDTLTGDAGANTISGGAGTDTVSYANSTSAVTVTINGAVSGGAGIDTLTGFENLTGSAYNDTLSGDAGANTITGGAGNDAINGGAGIDTLSGGGGGDTFKFSNATSIDSITDFNRVDSDQINLSLDFLVGGVKSVTHSYVSYTLMKGNGLRTSSNGSTSGVVSTSLYATQLFQAANATAFMGLINSKLASNKAAWAAGGNLNAVGFIRGTSSAAVGKIMIIGGIVQAGTNSVAFTGNTKTIVTLQSSITGVANSANAAVISGSDIYLF